MVGMANKSIFQTLRGALIPVTTTQNDAGGKAYELSPKAALARIAATGCITRTFYCSAETQLDRVLALANEVDTDFLAQAAIYSRQKGYMKDMPALLCAVLATRDLARLTEIFPQVIDNGKMLRNFVQIVRSGVTGRKSLGSAPKRLVRKWLEAASERQLLAAAIGNNPSLSDVVKMVHPRPGDATREAFYAWLVGKTYDPALLPETIRAYEAWKISKEGKVPEVPFQMLTALNLGEQEWAAIAETASWQMTRMNLNTFARHGVFKNKLLLEKIAKRLADPDQVKRSKVFPYQLLAAYTNTSDVPCVIREALQDAMETAIDNVPAISGNIVVCPDVSGSMQSSVTGYQKGASSKVRCIDVAALISAAFLRKNRNALVLPFEVGVVDLRLNPRDSVMTNAKKLVNIGGGGTNCSAPLTKLNKEQVSPDLVIFISDNESWADPKAQRGTAMMIEWEKIKSRNKKAKLVCIDIVPNTTAQVPDRKDILNIAGFSDQVFDLIAAFADGGDNEYNWIKEIESQPLNRYIKTA